jgi:large subunit ribosomal protein L4
MRVNKKMKKGALRSALTDALQSGKLVIVDDLRFDEPKTKRAAEVLGALGLVGKILLVLPEPTDDGAVERSFRNLPTVRIAYTKSLGVYEVIAADHVLFTAAALDAIEGRDAQAATRPELRAAEAEPERGATVATDPKDGDAE